MNKKIKILNYLTVTNEFKLKSDVLKAKVEKEIKVNMIYRKKNLDVGKLEESVWDILRNEKTLYSEFSFLQKKSEK